MIMGILKIVTASFLLAAMWATAEAQSKSTEEPNAAQPPAPISDCVQANELYNNEGQPRYRAGEEVLPLSQFFPAGAVVELVWKRSYDAVGERIFARFGDARMNVRAVVLSAQTIPADHALVKSNTVTGTATVVSIRIPSTETFFWNRRNIFLYACGRTAPGKSGDASTISIVARLTSSNSVSWVISLAAAAFFYGMIAMVSFRRMAEPRARVSMNYLDPVFISAGSDGRGSLSKLQILFFSTIVALLLTYFVARYGTLTSISDTLVWLMGISGGGATLAKATENIRGTLDPENRIWLESRGWVPDAESAKGKAKWRDVVAPDGEIDMFRYQNLVFSIIVGVALVIAGAGQLSSFEIPSSVLQMLGVSQAVYVAGKVVQPNAVADLNLATTATREAEATLRRAFHEKKLKAESLQQDLLAARSEVSAEYQNYMIEARKLEIVMKRSLKLSQLDPAMLRPVLAVDEGR